MYKIKNVLTYTLMAVLTALAVVGIGLMLYELIFHTEKITWP